MEAPEELAPKEPAGLAIFAIGAIYVISLIISYIDTLIDAGDATADAVTVGTVGVGTSVVDIISEIILELMQLGSFVLTLFLVSKVTGKEIPWAWLWITIFILLGLCDIVLSVVGLLPYFDLIETPLEWVSESIQSLLTFIVTKFN